MTPPHSSNMKAVDFFVAWLVVLVLFFALSVAKRDGWDSRKVEIISALPHLGGVE
jgi:hypothetical protein